MLAGAIVGILLILPMALPAVSNGHGHGVARHDTYQNAPRHDAHGSRGSRGRGSHGQVSVRA